MDDRRAVWPFLPELVSVEPLREDSGASTFWDPKAKRGKVDAPNDPDDKDEEDVASDDEPSDGPSSDGGEDDVKDDDSGEGEDAIGSDFVDEEMPATYAQGGVAQLQHTRSRNLSPNTHAIPMLLGKLLGNCIA